MFRANTTNTLSFQRNILFLFFSSWIWKKFYCTFLFSILPSILFLSSYSAFAQETIYKRKITLKQVFEEIKNCKDSIFILENALIDLDREKFNAARGYYDYGDSLQINVAIQLKDCKWQRKDVPVIQNINFLKTVSFFKVVDLGFVFVNCKFQDYFRYSFSVAPVMNFVNCKFFGAIDLFGNQQTGIFNNCTFHFKKATNLFQYRTKGVFFNMESWNDGKLDALMFSKCKFHSDLPEKFIKFAIKCNSFILQHCDFGNTVLDLESSHFQQVVEFQDCKIKNPVGLEAVIFPPSSTNISWNHLKGYKVALYDKYEEGSFRLKPEIQKNDSSIFNHFNYANYKAIYANLLNIYKIRGDQSSYNECYVEMKDIETRKYGFEYTKNPSLRNYVNWKLNQFLKTFCNYGTDPVSSILYAFYVIFCFAVIYFFFPSEKDNLKKEILLKKVDKYIRYFSTDTRLTEIHLEEKSQQLAELKALKEKLENSHKRVPPVLQVISYPFYIASLWYYQLNFWFVKRAEISAGIWEQQSKMQKFLSSILLSLYFLFFIVSGLLMRCLNALMLSINVFVTLGYGEIPAKGIAKYLAVLEGLIGWFLLSIFSVSLISQILQ